jgi:TonB-linked SusC/RagA family outer membrane protein
MKKTNEKNLCRFLKLGKLLLLCFICLLPVSSALAQTKTITGKVTDDTGEPVSGASISIKGTSIGTISKLDGTYVITDDVKDNSILVFSFIGMKTAEAPIGDQSIIDMVLQNDYMKMNEVVVVGYGTQQKKDVTGSVALVKASDLSDRLNTQVSSLIEGKATGVQVLSSSGKPSQGLSMRIRGTNSINASSEPLYVVDGVPTTDTRSLNPADIESLTILKDASSSAIYGAQGANGVVIITTKKGSTDKPSVSVDLYSGFSQVWKTLPVLNGEQYRDLMTELGQNTDWTKYNKNTDWQNEIFQNGVSQNAQVSVSGKNEKTNYYLSGGYMKQQGAVRSSTMDRMNFKVNIDQQVNNWMTIGSRIAYTKYSDVDVVDNTSVNSGGVLMGAISTPSVIGIYNPDGTFTSNPFQNWENPIAATDGASRNYVNNRILGNVYVTIKPFKDLTFKSNLGIDNSNSIYDYFLDPYKTSYGRALQGRAQNNTSSTKFYIFENTFTYHTKFAKHSLEALAGSVIQNTRWENNSIQTDNFGSASVHTTNAGSIISGASNDKAEKANASFIGRINYTFADKYLLTANFRTDGSSNFGPETRWGYFPSVSAGWRISQESFMPELPALSDLKLRAGWGIVGNDNIGNYAYYGKVNSGSNYPIGGSAQPGTYPSSIQNNNLQWESSKQINAGIDLALFRNRIRFTADAYLKKTSDLLLNAPLPTSTGFDNAVQNIGALENKGLEFSLNTVNIDKALVWSTDFNISFNKNKVTNLVGQQLFDGDVAGRGQASLVQEGLPLGTIYGYVFGGVDPATGNAYYVDKTGVSTFTPTADDRMVIGDANPKFLYGLTNTLSYKGISLMIFIAGSQGNDMLNGTRIDAEGMSDPKNQSTAVLRRWRNPGDVTDIPKSSWGVTDNSRISTRFIEDGSYLRLKTVTLSYQIPKKVISKVKLTSVRLYATGENLLTFTNYSGFDPEVNAFGGSNTARGIEYGTYPQTRNIIFGVNLTF